MVEGKVRGILIDVDYSTDQKKDICLNLFVKTPKGLEIFEERKFKPYFYVVVSDAEKAKKELLAREFGEEKIKIQRIEEVKPKNVEHALKLYFRNTMEVVSVREHVEGVPGVLEKREYDIPFTKRFMIDTGLEPMNGIELIVDGREIIQAKTVERSDVLKDLNFVAYDLETYSPGRFSDPQKDPIISISIATREGSEAFIWKIKPGKDNARYFKTEKEMFQAFIDRMKELQPDIVVTYNGDLFDFPYIKERGKQLKVDIRPAFMGYEPVEKRRGLDNAVKLKGIQHVDAYQLVRLLNRFGVLSLVKFDLESVNEAIYGVHKEKVYSTEINEIFNKGTPEQVDRLLDYNKKDSEATLRICLDYLSLYVEFSKLVHETIYDSSRAGASQLVEDLLIEKSHQNSFLIPNKPNEGEVKQRLLQTYTGGYVKEPIPGLHENIAVLDFRSLHPSIMIAHNISPETLKCGHNDCATGKNLSPDKDWFCEKKRGFIPMILEEILKKRVEAKTGMKKFPKDSEDYRLLHSKQQALKILLNSHYGYLVYARSRWYSRESARAITAWSRHYIRETTHKAEEAGYKPLYNDTDSAFIIMPKEKGEKDAREFVAKVNENLPGAMELEFEGIYKRGIFVTKKQGGAAKKRYALVDYEGNFKIVGFEYVRRDWAPIARNTQKSVIEAVLKEGNPEKAIKIVRETVDNLKKGKVEKKDLVILTQVKKPLNKYESIGPHIAAAMKAIKRGKDLTVGSTIGFVITRSGKSISDRAELEEYVKEGDYDADYYITHQVVPAVEKIISEFGVSKEDLIQGGTQKNLSSFM